MYTTIKKLLFATTVNYRFLAKAKTKKKTYVATEKGIQFLKKEIQRRKEMIKHAEDALEEFLNEKDKIHNERRNGFCRQQRFTKAQRLCEKGWLLDRFAFLRVYLKKERASRPSIFTRFFRKNADDEYFLLFKRCWMAAGLLNRSCHAYFQRISGNKTYLF